VKIGPVVSAENRLTNGNCVACSRGSAYVVEYLRIYWTDFWNLFTIWKPCMYRWWTCTIFSNTSNDVAMATKSFVHVWYNMAKKTGVFCQISPDKLDLFSQSFHHMTALYVQMMDLYFFPNFVNFRSVISEFTLLKRAILPPCTRNFRTIFIRHVGVSKWLEDHNFDFSRVIGKHFFTLYRNLVRFVSVTPEFKT